MKITIETQDESIIADLKRNPPVPFEIGLVKSGQKTIGGADIIQAVAVFISAVGLKVTSDVISKWIWKAIEGRAERANVEGKEARTQIELTRRIEETITTPTATIKRSASEKSVIRK